MNTLKTQLYQKSGLAVMHLARIFLSMKKGQRIQTISEYEQQLGFARGTIQNAMSTLKNDSAITLASKGHLGTIIVDLDYKLLWQYTGLELITGVMPLPYSKLYEGLATGLYNASGQFGTDLSIAYVRGSKVRIHMLLKGNCDFIVISEMAARHAIENGSDIEISMNFGKNSYLSEHVILFAQDDMTEISDGMKIGIDKKSYDQYLITKRLCEGKQIELVDMPYNQIVPSILSKKIDAGVWNLDEIKEKDLKVSYKHIHSFPELFTSSTAVVVTTKTNNMNHILKEMIDRELVLEYQRKVVQLEMDPSY